MNKIFQKFQAYDRSTHYIQERIHIHFCHRQRCLNFLHGKNIGSAQCGEILSKRVFLSDEPTRYFLKHFFKRYLSSVVWHIFALLHTKKFFDYPRMHLPNGLSHYITFYIFSPVFYDILNISVFLVQEVPR